MNVFTKLFSSLSITIRLCGSKFGLPNTVSFNVVYDSHSHSYSEVNFSGITTVTVSHMHPNRLLVTAFRVDFTLILAHLHLPHSWFNDIASLERLVSIEHDIT